MCALEEEEKKCKTYSIIHDYPRGNEAENYFVKYKTFCISQPFS